jgi:hypothetical protein
MGKSITKGWYYNATRGKYEFGVYNSAGDIYAPFDEDGIINPVIAGEDFYVNVNAGVDTNSGKSKVTALKTLAAAIVLSNASIAAGAYGWAARNRIFFEGDNNEAAKETLITLPNKCDVIGVGSYDHRPYPMMIGNHVIGAGAYMGTRFINMGFKSLAAGGAIFTVPGTTSGLKFINCFIDGSSTTVATYGIVATAVEQLEIIDCEFIGLFSAAAISIGAGESNGLRIMNNIIQSAAIGVKVSATMTASVRDAIIAYNLFDVGTLCVDDTSGAKVRVFENRGRTAANGSIDETLVCTAALSCNNIITCSAGTQSIYPPIAAIPA